LSRCSGGIEGRPRSAYIASNSSDSRASADSTIGLMPRIGWSSGMKRSGVTASSMLA
jgi:hypothetical protein